MYELRKYQSEAVKVALEFINDKKSTKKPIIVAPTGTGKLTIC